MDSWNGERLQGADRKLSCAQLEAVDSVVRAVLQVRAATGGKGPAWDRVREALAPAR